jgi:5-methylcytosine-specific restriction endonuclease McrA
MNLSSTIRTNVQKVAPAMLSTSGSVVKPVRRSGMFILIGKKKCSKCGEEKPLSDFYVDKRNVRSAKCKKCHNAHSVKYNHSHREQRRKTQTRYRLAHPEKVKGMFRAWYGSSEVARQKAIENARRWGKNNPERARQLGADKTRARRAQKKGNGGAFSPDEWRSLKEHYNFTCLKCGRHEPEIKLTPDHVLPVTKGGSSYISNIQPLCESCNSSKGAKHIDYRNRK